MPFAGYQVGAEGVKPHTDRTRAIADFPKPKDISELRGFLGLVNQLGHFIPDLAHVTNPLRELLKKDIQFQWLEEHDKAFNDTKSLLLRDMSVQPFDTSKVTHLLTDASRSGLGFALIQLNEDGRKSLVTCGSRSLSDPESRYAVIELECLAVRWAVEKCRHFLAGAKHFQVTTDHRPLVGAFNKTLDDVANARIQRWREWLASYTFDVVWVPGKTHEIADALSRAPVFAADMHDVEVLVRTINKGEWTPQLLTGMSRLKHSASVDREYQELLRALRAHKPTKELKCVWHRLSEQDGLVMYDATRIVIPRNERDSILQALHASHNGEVKTKQAARQAYFWKRMGEDIEEAIANCEECRRRQSSKSDAPFLPQNRGELYPMSELGIDLFELNGRNYIVCVDKFSGWPFVRELRRTHTKAVLDILDDWLLEWGKPRAIRSDGGPQFRSEFKEWCKSQDIEHQLASPHNPQSNGLAEAAVKNVKNLLKKVGNRELRRALRE